MPQQECCCSAPALSHTVGMNLMLRMVRRAGQAAQLRWMVRLACSHSRAHLWPPSIRARFFLGRATTLLEILGSWIPHSVDARQLEIRL